MKAKSDCRPDCACDRTGSGSCCDSRRAMVAGVLGGIVAVVVLGALAALACRRFGPRMMRACGCSAEMKACMEKCGCGSPTEEPPAS